MSMIFVLLGSICEYPSDPFVEAKHIEISYFIWMLICLWISINQPAISWFMRPPSDLEAMTLQKLQDFTPQHTHPGCWWDGGKRKPDHFGHFLCNEIFQGRSQVAQVMGSLGKDKQINQLMGRRKMTQNSKQRVIHPWTSTTFRAPLNSLVAPWWGSSQYRHQCSICDELKPHISND